MKRTEVFKDTNDNWCRSYPNNQCKLKYIGELSDGLFRVIVRGNDDLGIEKDFKEERDAIECFVNLRLRTKIDMQDLYDLGFINA